jgi:hypothetical protein
MKLPRIIKLYSTWVLECPLDHGRFYYFDSFADAVAGFGIVSGAAELAHRFPTMARPSVARYGVA